MERRAKGRGFKLKKSTPLKFFKGLMGGALGSRKLNSGVGGALSKATRGLANIF